MKIVLQLEVKLARLPITRKEVGGFAGQVVFFLIEAIGVMIPWERRIENAY